MTAPAPPPSAQLSQAGLAIATSNAADLAFARLDIGKLSTSLPQFNQLVAALINRYGMASATLAARQYKLARATASVSGAFTVKPASPAPMDQIGQSLDWATQPLWSDKPDVEAAKSNVHGIAERLVLQPGRQTIVDNVQRDAKALGWARDVEPGACSFCVLLASRGAVYGQSTADFRAHNHCRCHASPVFTAHEPSAEVRLAEKIYADLQPGSAKQKRNQFRVAWENRATQQ